MKWFWVADDLHSDPPRFRILTSGAFCIAVDDRTGERSGLLEAPAARDWCEKRQENEQKADGTTSNSGS